MAGLVITIAQQKGGSGKTTVAANLAVAFARRGLSTALLDTDPQGSLGRWFMTRVEATRGAPGLEFATASAWGAAYECEKLKRAHDIVLIDTPPKIDADLRPSLRQADIVLVPISVSQLDLWATEGVLDLAEREDRPVRIVLNRANARARLTGEVADAARALDAGLLATTLGNRVVFADALGRGQGVQERGRSPAAAEVAALAQELMGLLTR